MPTPRKRRKTPAEVSAEQAAYQAAQSALTGVLEPDEPPTDPDNAELVKLGVSTAQALAQEAPTICRSTLVNWVWVNSPNVPETVNDDGVRRRYVNPNWIVEGPADGTEAAVIVETVVDNVRPYRHGPLWRGEVAANPDVLTAAIQNYLTREPYVCPACGDGDPECCDLVMDGAEIAQRISCRCGAEWTDIYRLEAVEFRGRIVRAETGGGA